MSGEIPTERRKSGRNRKHMRIQDLHPQALKEIERAMKQDLQKKEALTGPEREKRESHEN